MSIPPKRQTEMREKKFKKQATRILPLYLNQLLYVSKVIPNRRRLHITDNIFICSRRSRTTSKILSGPELIALITVPTHAISLLPARVVAFNVLLCITIQVTCAQPEICRISTQWTWTLVF